MKTAVKSGNIDLQVFGKENIPKEDGFLRYANYQGLFDIVALVASCDKPWAAVLKKELYKLPLIKQMVDCTKSFLMDREDIRQSMQVILSVAKEVENGRNYLIFPEGTRSKKVTVQIHYLKPIYYEEYKDLNTVELAKMVHSRIEKIINEKAGIDRSKEGT